MVKQIAAYDAQARKEWSKDGKPTAETDDNSSVASTQTYATAAGAASSSASTAASMPPPSTIPDKAKRKLGRQPQPFCAAGRPDACTESGGKEATEVAGTKAAPVPDWKTKKVIQETNVKEEEEPPISGAASGAAGSGGSPAINGDECEVGEGTQEEFEEESMTVYALATGQSPRKLVRCPASLTG